MGCSVAVPEPVVGVEGDSCVVVYLSVEGTPVASILGYAHHALIGAVERSVERATLGLCATLDLNLPEGFGPLVACRLGHQLYLIGLDLTLYIAPCLLYTDIGDAVA